MESVRRVNQHLGQISVSLVREEVTVGWKITTLMVTTMMARRVMAIMATRTPTSSRNIWNMEMMEEVMDVKSL